MKKLCLGTFLKIISQAKLSFSKQVSLYHSLFSFLSTKEIYKNDTLQGHLKSGKNNFVDTDEVENIDKSIIVNTFKNKIIPQLDPKLHRQVILAIKDVLSEDNIDDMTVIGFESTGYTKQDIINKTIFNFEETLANVFYYCLVKVKNIPYKENIKEIDNKNYVYSFTAFKDKIMIEEENIVITSKIPSTLNKSQFDEVFFEIASTNLTIPNSNKVSIFCLDILNSLIDYSAVKKFIFKNIGRYVFSRAERNNYTIKGDAETIGASAIKAFNKKLKKDPDINHFNEIMLYSFLECVLGAPKLFSKMELQNKSGEYNLYSSGIHILTLKKGSFPFNQFVFGASNSYDSLKGAVDNSFVQVRKILSSNDEYELIESTILQNQFDAETNKILCNMLFPKKGDVITKYDKAIGLFLGYSISLSNEGLSNTEYRNAVIEKLKTDINNITQYINSKIASLGLANYSFYIYVLPLNNALVDTEAIIKEALEVY